MTKKHLIQLADIVVEAKLNAVSKFDKSLGINEDYAIGYRSCAWDMIDAIKEFAELNSKNFDANKWHEYITKKVSK